MTKPCLMIYETPYAEGRTFGWQNSIVDFYHADVISASDYYPFGMIMPDRSYEKVTYEEKVSKTFDSGTDGFFVCTWANGNVSITNYNGSLKMTTTTPTNTKVEAIQVKIDAGNATTPELERGKTYKLTFDLTVNYTTYRPFLLIYETPYTAGTTYEYMAELESNGTQTQYFTVPDNDNVNGIAFRLYFLGEERGSGKEVLIDDFVIEEANADLEEQAKLYDKANFSTGVDGFTGVGATLTQEVSTERLKVVTSSGNPSGAKKSYANMNRGSYYRVSFDVDLGTTGGITFDFQKDDTWVFHTANITTSGHYEYVVFSLSDAVEINFEYTGGVHPKEFYLDNYKVEEMQYDELNASAYRFGFQRQEMDDELKGKGNSTNFKYRMHDPRVGRFFAVDPLASKYAYNSPYAFAENKLGLGIELEGLEITGWGGVANQAPDATTIIQASTVFNNFMNQFVLIGAGNGAQFTATRSGRYSNFPVQFNVIIAPANSGSGGFCQIEVASGAGWTSLESFVNSGGNVNSVGQNQLRIGVTYSFDPNARMIDNLIVILHEPTVHLEERALILNRFLTDPAYTIQNLFQDEIIIGFLEEAHIEAFRREGVFNDVASDILNQLYTNLRNLNETFINKGINRVADDLVKYYNSDPSRTSSTPFGYYSLNKNNLYKLSQEFKKSVQTHNDSYNPANRGAFGNELRTNERLRNAIRQYQFLNGLIEIED